MDYVTITPVYKLPTLYETFWDWSNKVEMCDLESDEITEQIYSFSTGIYSCSYFGCGIPFTVVAGSKFTYIVEKCKDELSANSPWISLLKVSFGCVQFYPLKLSLCSWHKTDMHILTIFLRFGSSVENKR